MLFFPSQFLNIITLIVFLFSGMSSFNGRYPSLEAQDEEAVVRAVLFYSPSCPHCHQVITEDLPPLFQKYGEKLEMVGVDTSSEGGSALFLAAIEKFELPPEYQAVPLLIIDDVILIGGNQIPEQFPGLIEEYLAKGGVDWPDIPGLREALEASDADATPVDEEPSPEVTAETSEDLVPTSTPLPAPVETSQTPEPSVTPTNAAGNLILTEDSSGGLLARLQRDLAGNILAIVVLAGMIVSVGMVAAMLFSTKFMFNFNSPPWLIPVLCVIGLGVAGYLAYVEMTLVTAVCGPVGDCNTVQQSEYARLFGIIPIGLLGVVAYLVIIILWLFTRLEKGIISTLASAALLAITIFGTLFSIYLTFLEPFVIGATCIWCVSSAIIMTVLLWLSVIPGKQAFRSLLTKRDVPMRSSVRSSR